MRDFMFGFMWALGVLFVLYTIMDWVLR